MEVQNAGCVSCLKDQVGARAVNLVKLPITAVVSVAETAFGAVVGCATILTGGLFKYDFSMEHLQESGKIIAGPFAFLVRILNPKAKFGKLEDGSLTKTVHEKLTSKAEKFCNEESFVKKQIASRLTYGGLAVACVGARVADLVIGIFAATLSLLTLGNYKSLNDTAGCSLQVTKIVYDLFFCVVKIINPRAGTKSQENDDF